MQCEKCPNDIEQAKINRLAAKGKTARYCEACNAKMLNIRRAKINRLAYKAVMESCGLVKVRGALGGVYYE